MNTFRRWLAAALAAALTASASISLGLAAPPAEPFADFRIDASGMDVPDRTVAIALYRPDENGTFQWSEEQDCDCKVNRVTGDAAFYIQPKTDGVRVTVDYLTDVNGDGLYELLEGSPARDALDAQGSLVQDGTESLTPGQTYILSAELLAARYQTAVQSRTQALAHDIAPDTPVSPGFPLCQVTLSRTDPADGQEYEQLYYLELYGKILVPSDLVPSQWYYSAVEYGLSRGYFTGMEDGRFGPDEPLNRAQLAQVLWTVDGAPEAEPADFSDVSPDDWFCQPVSWCQQEGLISGYDGGIFAPNAPLTREQLASILYRYARYTGASLRTSANLSQYEDQGDVSLWAYDSMRWAVANRLLTATGNALRPGDTVTRAELAAALYAYDINLGARNMW